MISWNEVLLRIAGSAFDEVCLDIFELEFLLEIINDKVDIYAVLTGVYISRNEAALWKSVDTDMALRNHKNAAPAARVLDMVIRGGVDLHMRLTEWTHSESIAEPQEAREHGLLVVESIVVAPIAVNGYVFPEVC